MENVSQHTQHGFATIHDRLDGWFNLTGGEPVDGYVKARLFGEQPS